MAYGKELREKAVSAVEQGYSQHEVAKMFNIGTATLERWLRRKREAGHVEAYRQVGRSCKIGKEGLNVLKTHVSQRPTASLSERCAYIAEQGYELVSTPTMSRMLKKIGV